MVAERSVC